MQGAAHDVDLLQGDAASAYADAFHGFHGVDVPRPAVFAVDAQGVVECLRVVDGLCGRFDAEVLHAALAETLHVVGYPQGGVAVGVSGVVGVCQGDGEGDCVTVDGGDGAFGNQQSSFLDPGLGLSVAHEVVHLEVFDPFPGYGFAYFDVVSYG